MISWTRACEWLVVRIGVCFTFGPIHSEHVQVVYLDYNCFQRPFDNPLDTRIQIEALACLEVIRWADESKIELVWSFMHEDESLLCPYPDRRTEMLLLAGVCRRRQGPAESIRERAKALVRAAPFRQRRLASRRGRGIRCGLPGHLRRRLSAPGRDAPALELL